MRDIQTLEQLEAAIREGQERVSRQRNRLRTACDTVRSSYSPQALIGEGVRRSTRSLPVYGVLLRAVGAARKWLKKK